MGAFTKDSRVLLYAIWSEFLLGFVKSFELASFLHCSLMISEF